MFNKFDNLSNLTVNPSLSVVQTVTIQVKKVTV